MDRIPPQCAALLLAEYPKPVVGKHLIKRVTMRIIERHRSRRVLATVHNEFEGTTAVFVRELRPVALHTMPRTNRGQRRPHTRMPVKNSAAGIETKRLDIAHAHDVAPPCVNAARVGDGRSVPQVQGKAPSIVARWRQIRLTTSTPSTWRISAKIAAVSPVAAASVMAGTGSLMLASCDAIAFDGVRIPGHPRTGPVRHLRQVVDDAQRLRQDRRRPIDIFKPGAGRRGGEQMRTDLWKDGRGHLDPSRRG